MTDIIGKKFNHLTVIKLDEKRNQESFLRYKNGEIKRVPIYCLCKCDCGKEELVSVEKASLTRTTNPVKSCGCQRLRANNERKGKVFSENDLIGQKFGRLTVLAKSENRAGVRKKIMWICQCECGEIKEITGESLKSGTTKSCGCIYKETRSQIAKSYNTYDLTTKEYGIGYCTNGSEFYFDKEDYDKIKDYCWNYDGRYVQTHKIKLLEDNDNYDTKIIRFHRLVFNLDNRENINIDHINGIRYDNRKSNLRRATDLENASNKERYHCTSENLVGIKKSKGKYNVTIRKELIGSYNTLEEAIENRVKMEKIIYKDFIRET